MLLRIIPVCLLFLCCSQPDGKNPLVEIRTKFGSIVVEVYPGRAPKSAGAFLTYADEGIYRNASFYRVLNLGNQPSDHYKSELIQGGLWRRNRKRADAIQGIPHESTRETGLLHKDGVISFARFEPGSAKTEFFICIGDQPGFDFGGENNPDGQGYAAFGKVIKGMEVVREIYSKPEFDQAFEPPIDIYNIVRL